MIPAIVSALMLAEYVVLGLLFDAQALLQTSGWSLWIGTLGSAGPILIAIPAAALLLGHKQLGQAWTKARALGSSRNRTLTLLLVHLLAYLGVIVLTDALLTNPQSRLLAGLWLITALSSIALAVSSLLPWKGLVLFTSIAKRPLLLGSLVGAGGWAAGQLTEALYEPLAFATLHVSYAVLRLIVANPQMDASLLELGTENFLVEVAPACSGYEGLGVVLIFLLSFLYQARRTLRFPNALALIPIALLLVWLFNSVRIALLIAIGDTMSSEIALAGFHSKAGWIIVCSIALASAVVARHSPLFAKDALRGEDSENPTAAYLVPLMVLIAVSMLTGAFADGIDMLYPLRIVAVVGVLFLYRAYYRHALRKYLWSWYPVLTGVAAFIAWVLLEPTADPMAVRQGRDAIALAGSLGTVYLVARALGSSFIVPIAEELVFRGYLLKRLAGQDFEIGSRIPFAPLAVILSSLAFGLLHQRWLAATLVGVMYAWTAYRRSRVSDAILAHATTNLLLTVYVLYFGHWHFWL